MSNHSFMTDLGVSSPGAKGPPAIGPKVVHESRGGAQGVVEFTCYLYGHGNLGRDDGFVELRIERAVCIPSIVIKDKAGKEDMS